MPSESCPNCGTSVETEPGQPLDCPECDYSGSPADDGQTSNPSTWDFTQGFDLDDEQRAWLERVRSLGKRFGAVAGFAIGLGLVLVGVGNGVFRLTDLGDPGGPGGVFAFMFHLLIAAVLVMLGATLLPVGLRFAGRDRDASVEQAALVFAVLWLVVGLFGTMVGAPIGPGAVEGGIVLVLAGILGLIAISSYDTRRTGPSITAGVLGLVAGGLLIGGAATVPSLISQSARFGSDVVFRFADPVHGSGLLLAILAAAFYPFVEASREGKAGVLLTAAAGGVVWGVGEIVFAVEWLTDTPWGLFGTLSPGASVGFAFVVVGGFATIVGGLAGLAASVAGVGYAGLPLTTLIPSSATQSRAAGTDGAGSSKTWTCPSCGSTVTGRRGECPGCGREVGDPCPDCGHLVEPDASFCPECGSQIAEAG